MNPAIWGFDEMNPLQQLAAVNLTPERADCVAR